LLQAIPAIDIMKGKVVRLTQGDPNLVKQYDFIGSPIEFTEKWKREGAEKLHIIDLDAAFSKGDNRALIIEIAKTIRLPIQVGGGIREIETARNLLNNGVTWVILGSLAFSEPNAIAELQKEFGKDRIIVALDNKEGKIMVQGWKSATEFTVSQALQEFSRREVRTFLITSIAKDGMLSGPDLETLGKACKFPDIDVIAAGGIGSRRDLTALKEVGVKAAVIGKALYEGRFTLKEAIDTAKGETIKQ
jgi:phosphoribosylformimino-5-aminoimidazole carboxamide ribotide isomerase